jgi:putative membrane protein
MEWHLHPDVIFWMCLLEAGYLALVLRESRLRVGERVVTRRQIALYTSGVFILWVASGTPIHDWGEKYLFSVHMTQHLLITMIAPPLLLLGTPAWLFRPVLTRRWILPVARVITLPILGIIIFNATTLVTHLPPFVNYVLVNHPVHFLAHVLIFFTAIIMWWPVFSPMPELPRLSFGGQMVYLFVQSLVPSIIASFMTYGSTVLYTFYAQAPRRWGMTPIGDQVMAGLIMKLTGATLIFGLMTIVFFRWYNQEQREHPDPLEALDANLPPDLTWEDIEAELDRMGLTHSRS